MRKFKYALLSLIVITFFVYAFLKNQWNSFERLDPIGVVIKTKSNDLEEVAKQWVKNCINYYDGITVPYSYRLKAAKVENIEILNSQKGYVQIDYLIKPTYVNDYILQNFNGISLKEDNWWLMQEVVRFELAEEGYKVTELMRPAAYQIMSDPNILTEGKEGTIQYEAQKNIDYVVKKGILYITYDKGSTLKEVPVDYDTVTYNPMNSSNTTIQEGSYIITPEYVGFLYVDKGLKLIYSLDQGETWHNETVVNNATGYYRTRFLSKTENYYYVVYASDKSMSAEGHGFYKSSDGIHFESTTFADPEQRVMTYAYFASDNIGYVAYAKNEAGKSRSFYRTEDGGQSFTPIDFDLYEISIAEYEFTPFIQVNKIYIEEGIFHLIVGQGENGDYGHNLAEYISEDGIHFTFYQQIKATSREGG